MIDDESATGDLEAELGDEGGYPSAEDGAMHITKEVPGGVDKDIDSYTGDPVEDLDFREERLAGTGRANAQRHSD